jgi:hypothetical protein
MPPPILASPLAIAKTGTPNLKLKGLSSLLLAFRKFVKENIKEECHLSWRHDMYLLILFLLDLD